MVPMKENTNLVFRYCQGPLLPDQEFAVRLDN